MIAGGAGKTPVTLALARHLRDSGWSPGIVSRGYGRSTDDCREALPESAPADVGDEPALLARASGVPVFVARKRIEAQGSNVEQAEKGYAIATTRYQDGSGTQLEVNDADVALMRARVNKAQAMYDYLVARADLEQALSMHQE